MARVDPDRLSALTGQFNALMQQPLVPLTRGRLPVPDAVYIFYQYGEPLVVGSPPHVDEVRMLAPSFRGGFSIRLGHPGEPESVPMPFTKASGDRRPAPPIQARWIRIEDAFTRMLVEIYAAQKLGLTITHPKLRKALTGTDFKQMETILA